MLDRRAVAGLDDALDQLLLLGRLDLAATARSKISSGLQLRVARPAGRVDERDVELLDDLPVREEERRLHPEVAPAGVLRDRRLLAGGGRRSGRPWRRSGWAGSPRRSSPKSTTRPGLEGPTARLTPETTAAGEGSRGRGRLPPVMRLAASRRPGSRPAGPADPPVRSSPPGFHPSHHPLRLCAASRSVMRLRPSTAGVLSSPGRRLDAAAARAHRIPSNVVQCGTFRTTMDVSSLAATGRFEADTWRSTSSGSSGASPPTSPRPPRRGADRGPPGDRALPGPRRADCRAHDPQAHPGHRRRQPRRSNRRGRADRYAEVVEMSDVAVDRRGRGRRAGRCCCRCAVPDELARRRAGRGADHLRASGRARSADGRTAWASASSPVAARSILPGVTKVRTLSLEAHESEITVPCVSQQKIRLDLRGVVVYKVGDDFPSIANAARRFLDRPAAELESKVQNVFVGHLRAIAGSMTVEEMISDQDKFAQQVRDRCSQEMESFGLVIDSFQIQEITSPSNYIENLAVPHQAEVEQNARIARANADRTAVAAGAGRGRPDRRRRSATRRSRRPASRPRSTGPTRTPPSRARWPRRPRARRSSRRRRRSPSSRPSRRSSSSRSTCASPADAEAYKQTTLATAGRDVAIRQAEAEAQQVRLAAEAAGGGDQGPGRGPGRRDPPQRPGRSRRDPRARPGRGRRRPGADGGRGGRHRAASAALSQNQEAVIAQQIAENLPAIVQAAASPFEHVGIFTVLNGAEGVTGALAEIIQQAGALSSMAREALMPQAVANGAVRSANGVKPVRGGTIGGAGQGACGAGEARCSDRRVERLGRGPQGAVGGDGFFGGRVAQSRRRPTDVGASRGRRGPGRGRRTGTIARAGPDAARRVRQRPMPRRSPSSKTASPSTFRPTSRPGSSRWPAGSSRVSSRLRSGRRRSAARSGPSTGSANGRSPRRPRSRPGSRTGRSGCSRTSSASARL